MEIAERLIGKGYELRIFDPNVNVPKMVWRPTGATSSTRSRISRDLMVSTIDEVVDHARNLVIEQGRDRSAGQSPSVHGQGGGWSTSSASPPDARWEGYHGLCW